MFCGVSVDIEAEMAIVSSNGQGASIMLSVAI